MIGSDPLKVPVCVADEGFTVLADPGEATADIVLLHGIQGHPKKTWLYEKNNRNLFKRDKEICYWPQDVLPTHFRKCRILTFGYDSHVSHSFAGAANQTNILGHARAFLDEFEDLRRGSPGRPLVFVAHSLGGLLLKAILRQASEADVHPHDGIIHIVCESTVGAIFLGTPHRGSDYAQLGQIVALAARAIQFDRSTSLLRDMKVDASMLEVLNDSFLKVVEKYQFAITTFEEGRGLGVPIIARDRVVTPWSAHLGLPDSMEQKQVINADHRKMCQFEGPEAAGYGKIKRAIERCLRKGAVPSMDADAARAIQGLYTVETRIRYESVEQRHKDTYEWIFTDISLGFKGWLQSAAPLYWIKGKPASGKSTLMKMIIDDKRTLCACRREGQKTSISAFFFHDRGSQLQKSLDGLMREILHTLLKDIPELRPLYVDAYREQIPRIRSGLAFT